MNLSKRQAQLQDATSIAELSIQLGYKSSIAETQARLEEILRHADHCIFVVMNEDTLVAWVHGFVSYRLESNSFVEIGGLVVDENYRRKGIGKLLVQEVMDWSRNNHCLKVRVRCNRVREETHVFYKHLGFEETKEQKVFDLKL